MEPSALDDLRTRIEVEETARLWGQKHTITPRLVGQIWGDGKKLIGIQPLNTRPNYYVVCGDSNWDLESDEFMDLAEDEIFTAIEEEYGSRDCRYCGGSFGEDGCEHCRGEDWREFPALNIDAGWCWFDIRRGVAGGAE